MKRSSKKPRKPLRKPRKEAKPRKPEASRKNSETRENLEIMLGEYELKSKFYEFRARRLDDLLSRNSAAKLSYEKKTKLTKQLEEAREEHSFCQVAMDQIAFRMTQLPEEKT